jgi:hypothetical protein
MKNISDRNDLRREVNDLMGSAADEAAIDAAVDAIYADSSRPQYGDDWQEYLDGVDLWEMATVTLADYASNRENVCVFFASIGTPAGDYLPLGVPQVDDEFTERLASLRGYVDEHGDWAWDGNGDPRDCRGNTVTKVQAYQDRTRWTNLTSEWWDRV